MAVRSHRPLTLALIAALTGLLTLILATTATAQPRKPHDRRPLTLTAEAAAKGIEPGNAPMGWRNSEATSANQRVASSQVAKAAFVPSGVLGIDVASYQGNVNWASYYSAGKRFAYVKATEGTSYKNPYFSSQYTGSYKAGFIRGAYHFASPNGKSGAEQAKYFVSNGGSWSKDGKTLPGVLDIEYNPYGASCYGVSKTKMVAWITDFVTTYKKLTTRDVVIYTTADWWKTCTGNTTKFNKTNPLWVARYGTSAGTLPGSWPYYTFWQYSSTPIDQNTFSSTLTQLKKLATG